MPFDYITNLNAIVNVLEEHNTTTASPDLSEGLSTRVKSIMKDDWNVVSTKRLDFPLIYVRIKEKAEQYDALGATGSTGRMKRASVQYDLIGLYAQDGIYSPHADILTELYTLAGNIEGVLQQEFTLSNTCLWCNPEATAFDEINNNGKWVKGVAIKLKAEYLFR